MLPLEEYEEIYKKLLFENYKDQAKKEKKKVSEAKTKLEKEYKGKIRLVTFTMEEMLEERRAEALKKNYLKFPYRCEYCITGFDHELALKSHMKARHDKKSNGIECKICNSILGTKISFNRHHKRHFRRYECIECGRRNNYLFSAVKHYNEKHGRIKTVFTCELCDFSTESHRVYEYHRNKHRMKKVECQVCGNKFVTKNGLNTHMFTVHGQSRRVYSCEECGKQYRAKSGLWAHAAAHAPSPAYCAECDAHFTSQLRLKSHLKRHSKHNERRFACNECDAIFKVKKSLQDHIELMHLNNTKHACNKCNKAFINSSSLKTHREVVHEKKRPPRNIICDHCGIGFTVSLQKLNNELKIFVCL
ncbi:unnamed protein product [Euphydryas editha]|uniref:C2H2-type domain-containing protein n=1 Tax=Euphydryas editha TaxID=104508 RepID=A0AAU9T9S7_EUPED|nr:unnamed protein product [Euphydryas editha]